LREKYRRYIEPFKFKQRFAMRRESVSSSFGRRALHAKDHYSSTLNFEAVRAKFKITSAHISSPVARTPVQQHGRRQDHDGYSSASLTASL
jgi:hypothetical protein